jgi:hypothetical protein
LKNDKLRERTLQTKGRAVAGGEKHHGGKKNRSEAMRDREEEFEDSDEGIAPPERESPRPKGAGPRFSPAEDGFIVKQASECGDVVTIDDLDVIARRCNVKFHDQGKVRTGESLWWRIWREQKRGNPVYEEISVQQGSPKRTPGTRGKAAQKPSRPALERGMIDSALQTKNTVRPAGGKSKKGIEIDVVIRNPVTGDTERIRTKKFSSFEDILFALS